MTDTRMYVDGEPAERLPDDREWHQVAIVDPSGPILAHVRSVDGGESPDEVADALRRMATRGDDD